MNFAVGDMAGELDVLVQEIAAYERADARFLAAYVLLAGLNVRRDQYGVALAIDGSRQTLMHLVDMDEGIDLTKDVGGAALGLRIGPHFPNDWDLLELARAIAKKVDEGARKAALAAVVHATLVEGETRCWELRPLIDRVPVNAPAATPDPGTLSATVAVAQVAQMTEGRLNEDDVRRCLAAFATVVERGTEGGGRVEFPDLGWFSVDVQPNGSPKLIFQETPT